MASAEQAQGNHETLELPGRMHPVLGVLAFLPIMIIIVGILGLILETPPPLFMAIFASVLVCCAIISWQALAIMLGGSVEFMPEGLKVKRLFQEQVYPWRTLEKCKVMPGTGTLDDNAFAGPENRVGVGLFVRGSDPPPRTRPRRGRGAVRRRQWQCPGHDAYRAARTESDRSSRRGGEAPGPASFESLAAGRPSGARGAPSGPEKARRSPT